MELASKVVRCGNISGQGIDKFAKLGLTPVAASLVAAPLIDECYANLECEVVDTSMVSRYGFFVLGVDGVIIHLRNHAQVIEDTMESQKHSPIHRRQVFRHGLARAGSSIWAFSRVRTANLPVVGVSVG
ncbi:MAG: flavin reductase [Deltaproteobacteria bacterium]